LPVEEIQLIKSSVSVANLMRGLQGTDEDRCASHSHPARGVTHLHGSDEEDKKSLAPSMASSAQIQGADKEASRAGA
jgi:hypothetical protein